MVAVSGQVTHAHKRRSFKCLASRLLKMEAKIASLLNVSSSDKQKLNELISEYLSESFENSESETEYDEAFEDDDDDDLQHSIIYLN